MAESFVILAQLAAAVAAARLLGRLSARLGQPPVLGELLAGVSLGLWPFFGRGHEALGLLAEAGVLLLLFEAGLHCEPGKLRRAGPTAAAVALTGMAVPFALGWGLMAAFGRAPLERLFVGAAMTATSVGITARVLADLGRAASPEAVVILGAAVLDDVLGVGLLTWLQTLSPAAMGGGAAAKSVLIVGAFAAGVVLGASRRRAAIERLSRPATAWLAPVFFVVTGAGVDLSVLAPGSSASPRPCPSSPSPARPRAASPSGPRATTAGRSASAWCRAARWG
ncbi:MAG: cation:proton antiporter [Elusimicrobiota bacterium]|nr:MAG: cation:proton antiporter [Elusimicrobiota bacterium]